MSTQQDSSSLKVSRHLRRIGLALPIVTVIVIVLYLGRLTAAHDALRADTLAQAGQRAAQLADAKADQIESLLTGADVVVRQFRDQYALGNLEAVKATIKAGFDAFPKGSIIHYSFIDSAGYIAFSTLPVAGRVYVGDRDYFKFHAAQAVDQLFINKPFVARTTQGWMVLLTRPVIQGSRFAGVAVMSISPQFVASALAKLQVASNDVISLFFNDGSYFARSRDTDKVLGTSLPADRPFLRPDAADRGVFQVVANVDQRPRIYAWQKLGGLPLVLNVGFDLEATLAPAEAEIRRSHQRNAVALPLVFVLVGAISWLLFKSARQQTHLIAGRALLRATLDSTADGLLVVGQDGQVLDLNRRFKELWRIPDALAVAGQDKLLLQHVLDQLVDPDAFVKGVEALYQSDQQRTDYLVFKDGRTFERYTQSCLLNDQRARLWSFSDITELRQHRLHLEELVEERTAKLKLATEQLLDTQFAMERVGIGIHWTDADSGRFVYVNGVAARMLDRPVDELLGLTLAQVEAAPSAVEFGRLTTVARQLGQARMETTLRAANGSTVAVEMAIYHLPGKDGAQARFISFLTDIGERKAAEVALVRAKEAAEAGNAAKSAFLANMSHEIRTPLNAVTGMAYLMRRDGLSPRQSDRLDRIDTASQHLMEIVNAVLDLSKIEAGKFVLDESEVDVGAIMAAVASMLQQRVQAKQLQFVLRPPVACPRLLGDSTRLQQALLNYASNAVKFTDAGTITLCAEVQQASSDGVLLRFEVQDTGIGIAPQMLAKLFNAFEQGDNSTTRKYGGSGLGLTITRRLAELMGGQAGVSSSPASGSTFWFTARLGKASVAPVALALPDGQAVEMALRSGHHGRRVLVAEDDGFNREVARELLRHVGLDCDLAADGLEALELVAGNDYAVVLMDVQMPRMDGLEAAHQIRRLVKSGQPWIIAMSANAFAEDKALCLAAGMNDFIAKPVNPQVLYRTLLTWLSRPAPGPDGT